MVIRWLTCSLIFVFQNLVFLGRQKWLIFGAEDIGGCQLPMMRAPLIPGSVQHFAIRESDEDVVIWKHSSTGLFNINSVWQVIRSVRDEVSWFQLVWGRKYIPYHSFIVWLALNNHLAVNNRMYRWQLIEDSNCILCRQHEETVEQLFFYCVFSPNIWQNTLSKCQMDREVLPWRMEVNFFSRRARSKSLLSLVRRLYFCATVYWIWMERNFVIFQNQVPNSNRVIRRIVQAVSMRVEWDCFNVLYSAWLMYSVCYVLVCIDYSGVACILWLFVAQFSRPFASLSRCESRLSGGDELL